MQKIFDTFQPGSLVAQLAAVRHTDATLSKVIRERSGHTGTQALILVSLLKEDRASQARVVELTGIDRSTVADVIKRLVQEGHLTRQRSRTDTREKIVRLTETGRNAADRLRTLT